MIIAILFICVVFVALICTYYAFKTGVPTLASFPRAREKIVVTLKKDFGAHPQRRPYTIIDLGSGGGQLCTTIARALPEAKVFGIELSLFPWLRSIIMRRLLGPSNLTFMRSDFWAYDCSKADAIVVYLNGTVMDKIGPKLRRELKPGALIIVNENHLDQSWQPIEVIDNPIWGLFHSNIYVYRQG